MTLIALSLLANGQTKEIKIGDKISNIELAQIIRFKSNQGKLRTDFNNNNPLIIDFWNTHCGACIAFMPTLDSIVKENKGKINALMVAPEKSDKAVAFLNGRKLTKNLKTPSVTSDNILHKMFPHKIEPHEVWINKNGFVVAITGYEAVTRANIKKFILGEKLNLPVKNEINERGVLLGDISLSTIDEKYNQSGARLWYSYLSAYMPMVKGGGTFYNNYHDSELQRICERNKSVYDLYLSAFNLSSDSIKPYQYITRLKDSLKIKPNLDTHENIYCYDIIINDTSKLKTKIRMFMKRDLDAYLNITSSLEKKMLPCVVITRIPNSPVLSTNDKYTDSYNLNDRIVYTNTEWSRICYEINSFYVGQYQLIDETGYNNGLDKSGRPFKVDLLIPREWSDLASVNQKLKASGLRVELQQRLLTCIKLEDKQ